MVDRLLAFRQRQLSPAASLFVVLALLGIGMYVFVPLSDSGENKRIAKIHETVLLNAEMGYYQKHGEFVLGTDAELKPLSMLDSELDPGICTRGGHHSVIKYGKNGIVYHCSLNEGKGRIWVTSLSGAGPSK